MPINARDRLHRICRVIRRGRGKRATGSQHVSFRCDTRVGRSASAPLLITADRDFPGSVARVEQNVIHAGCKIAIPADLCGNERNDLRVRCRRFIDETGVSVFVEQQVYGGG